jgi:hypothetical protein
MPTSLPCLLLMGDIGNFILANNILGQVWVSQLFEIVKITLNTLFINVFN